jgi:uncharacterized membrane protein YbhN (UPF0104 family)
VTGGSATSKNRSTLQRALRVVAVVLCALVVYGLVQALRRDGPAALAAWRAADVRWTMVVVGAAFALAGQGIYVVGWQRLLNDYGVKSSFWLTAKFFLVSNLGRYLPGAKAWQMGIVGLMAAQNGLPAATVAATSLFQGMIGVAVGAILLFWTGGAVLQIPRIWFVLPIAGIIGLLALPALLKAVPPVHALLRKRMAGTESLTTGTMWSLVWTAAASWVLWGIALYALAVALLSDPGASLITYLAAWIGPFLAGVIAMVAPAGLGVRDELMRTILISANVSASSAIMIAVVARLWATVLEVVPAVLVLAIERGRVPVLGRPEPDAPLA